MAKNSFSWDVTLLVGQRTLIDPTTIGQSEALSYVAVPTYAPPDGQAKGKQTYVAAQTLAMPDGYRNAVVVDSPQSEANRVEERLAQVFGAQPRLAYPRVSIPFPDGVTLTNWQLSHRSADQILRITDYFDRDDRRLKGGPAFVNPYHDLTWFLEHFPIDVILGTWHSHRGPAVKLPRLLTATMIGYTPLTTADNADSHINRIARGAQKSDPIITGQAKVKKVNNLESPCPEEIVGFDFADKGSGAFRLSVAGLGDVPEGVRPGNVFALERVEQRISLALAPLRHAHFPLPGGKRNDARDTAGRDVLVNLALVAFRAALEIDGMLRSGCLLSPVPGQTSVRSVARDGSDAPVSIPGMDDLLKAYAESVAVASKHGFTFEEVIAQPKPALIELYTHRGKHVNREGPTDDAA